MHPIEGQRSLLGVNVGNPIETNWNLDAYCAEVREPIELSFGVVSGVGLGICALDGVHKPQGKGEVLGISVPLV